MNPKLKELKTIFFILLTKKTNYFREKIYKIVFANRFEFLLQSYQRRVYHIYICFYLRYKMVNVLINIFAINKN